MCSEKNKVRRCRTEKYLSDNDRTRILFQYEKVTCDLEQLSREFGVSTRAIFSVLYPRQMDDTPIPESHTSWAAPKQHTTDQPKVFYTKSHVRKHVEVPDGVNVLLDLHAFNQIRHF